MGADVKSLMCRSGENLLSHYRLVTLLFVSAIAYSAHACVPRGGPGGSDPQHFYGNFQTAVASVPDKQYQVYWLGREFRAGSLTFRGPEIPDFGAAANRDSMYVSYGARLSRGGVGLELSLLSPVGWESARGSYGSTPPGATSRQIMVAGSPATIIVIPAGTRPVNELRLIVHFRTTTVLVIATAGGAATPGGPDVNPLIDEETFLSVMQQLRPYPQ